MTKASISASRSGDFVIGGLVGLVLMAVSLPLAVFTLWIFIGGFIAIASLGAVVALAAVRLGQKRPYWAIGIICGYFVPPLIGVGLIHLGAHLELRRAQSLSSTVIAKPTRKHSVIDLSGIEHNDTLFLQITLGLDMTVVLPRRDGQQLEMMAAAGEACREDSQIAETLHLISQGVFDRCILRRPAQSHANALVIRYVDQEASGQQHSWKLVSTIEASERISGQERVLMRSAQGHVYPTGQFIFPSEIKKRGVAAFLDVLLGSDTAREFANLKMKDPVRALRLSLPWLGDSRPDVRRIASQVFERAIINRQSELRKAAREAGQRPSELPEWATFRIELLGMAEQLAGGLQTEQRHQAHVVRHLVDRFER